MTLELVVPPGTPAVRLDQFLASQLPAASRRRLRGAELRLNGRRAAPSTPVRPGDVITLPAALARPPELSTNAALDVAILHRDRHLVAVDKPAGMPSVARRAEDVDTVANFLVTRFPEARHAGGPLEGGLVHRLDTDTSGVLVAALESATHTALRQQFEQGAVEKEYLALVSGQLAAAGRVDTPIAHHPRRASRMIACGDAAEARRLGARTAATTFTPVLRYARETLVRVRMRTGVRHQVRVHLAEIGHPIVGDPLYNPEPRHRWIARLALHATTIHLGHPGDGAPLVLESPLAADLEAALRRLKR